MEKKMIMEYLSNQYGDQVGRGHGYTAEWIGRLIDKINNGEFEPPVPELSVGDEVVHKENSDIGRGVVKGIAKSGKRAFVDFGVIPDWNKKKLNWKPYPAYYLIEKLEKVLPQAIGTTE